jgi:hypothetical protein
MYDDHETRTLFYDSETNRFMDEMGNVIHDIYRWITPSQIMIFKEQHKGIWVVPDVTNTFLVELIDPDEFGV